MSPRDIHAIIKEEEARRQKYKAQQQRQELFQSLQTIFRKEDYSRSRHYTKPKGTRSNQI
ncbi:MAG TPA: hypothetical protein VE244_15085 [Nitrososphaeraceae archaeon]|jgi:hypothetical protein|nr:hypothetical protein [Nitrososphaeraceae archaeon]